MGGTQFNKRYTLNALTTAYNTLQYIKPVQLIVVWWMDIYSIQCMCGGISKQEVLLLIYVQSGPDSYYNRSEREVLDGML